MEARRPVDDVEELPGYLVGPDHVKMVEAELRGAPGVVVSQAARAIEILLWRLVAGKAEFGGGIELSGELLARGEIRADGSFVILVPEDVKAGDILVCQLAFRGGAEQLFVPSVLPGVLPLGATPAIIRQNSGWVGLDYERAATLESPAQPVTAESRQGIDGSEQYLADALESATSTESEADSTADVDEEVINEIAGEKAKKLAEKVLADLDADKSGSLTLEEFLAGPKKFVDKMPNLKVGAELDAKRKEKMTADFKANAGEDSLLSVDELAALLKSKAPHVACVRGKGRGGKIGHGPRGPQGRGGRRGPPPPHRREPLDDAQISEIIAKFDTDGDKVLNAAEFKEFMNARPGKVKVEVSEEVEKEGE